MVFGNQVRPIRVEYGVHMYTYCMSTAYVGNKYLYVSATMNEGKPIIEPRCVATSGTLYQCSVSETRRREASKLDGDQSSSSCSHNEESNNFKDAQWYRH